MLHVVLYGFETCSFTRRQENCFKVFENKVQRRVFGHKRKEVAGGWRILHNEELHNLYASPNIVTMMKSRRI
jgi:hypothetical protein